MSLILREKIEKLYDLMNKQNREITQMIAQLARIESQLTKQQEEDV